MVEHKFRHLVRVYLCGGFHSLWQEEVMKSVEDVSDFFYFYNPKDKELERPEEYWQWDLQAIKKSDIVFVYFEEWMAKKCGAGTIAEFG